MSAFMTPDDPLVDELDDEALDRPDLSRGGGACISSGDSILGPRDEPRDQPSDTALACGAMSGIR
jgi:hypothetical protein